MKSVYIFIAAMGMYVLVSCKKETQAPETSLTEKVTDTIKTNQPPIQKNNAGLQQLVASFISRKKEIQAALKSLSPKKADALYKAYAEENNDYINAITVKEQHLLENFYTYYNNDGSPPDSIQQKENLLKSAGLELWEIGEGYVDIRAQHDFYYTIFKNYVTPDYREFLQINSEEEKVLYSADAGLGVSFEEVGDRVLSWENFLKKYPDSDLIAQAKDFYRNYQKDYLFGMDNTPVMDSQNNTIYPENITEFNRFITKYPDSFTTKLVKIVLLNSANNDKVRAIIDAEQAKHIGEN